MILLLIHFAHKRMFAWLLWSSGSRTYRCINELMHEPNFDW